MKNILALLFLFIAITSVCQKNDEYEVFALKYLDGQKISATDAIIGANPSDSLDLCYMIWLLKGTSGKNILVDTGFIDSTKENENNYFRPDSILQRMDVLATDITDIILTHPHYDHIGGINLFPNAKVWMQEDDFNYFVGKLWQEGGDSMGYQKNDVRNLIEINLKGRLNLIKGDNIEIFPGIKVFTGSKHSFENQYLLVNSNSNTKKTLIASDAIWFYENLNKLLPAALCMDTTAYVKAMVRMKSLVTNQELIIPGHDNLVFSKFTPITDRVAKIE